MMTARFLQKVIVVVVLLTCTSLLYLNQFSSTDRLHPLPQDVLEHDESQPPEIPQQADKAQPTIAQQLDNPPPAITKQPEKPQQPAKPQPTVAARGYSVKPLAYIFPQYYTFPDNDRIHGKNFTEWVNVKKVTKNIWGLETIRPAEAIGGFYNGMELATRKRYATFLKDSGFHGAVFHHYWFAGRPVMEHVIEAMLKDGEPNMPFMLSWANEPWSARWDGKDGSGVLIAQEYGLQEAWRKHFDWLLPYFKHPNYIRSNGKVQFVIYNPTHVGHLGPHMWAAFKQWAVEEGLGGMDIIQTRWDNGESTQSWQYHPPDAINEFHPHVAGRDPAKYVATRRLSQVYHRGTLACWDTTPRHPTDGKAVSEPLCHPKRWKWHVLHMLEKIKSDPNPPGQENFFFVNALNEWGEGNSLEASVQFGNGYGEAMKAAMETSDKEHVWFSGPQMTDRLGLNRELNILVNATTPDVCAVIRTYPNHGEDQSYRLSSMLKSLQAQNNKNWRAVVIETFKSEFAGLDRIVIEALDPRIRHIKAPKEVAENITDASEKDRGWTATDWYIKNLTTLDPGCAAAKYLLVAEGGNTYEPHAFDVVATGTADLIGLNVESKETLWDNLRMFSNTSWNTTCDRLEVPGLQLWNTSEPTLQRFDLSATFIKFAKFKNETTTFSSFTSAFESQEAGAWAEFVTQQRSWSYEGPEGPEQQSCHVFHNPSYSTCMKTGNFWFDSPMFDEQTCYTSDRFSEMYGAKSRYMKDIDLQYFRGNGLCVRYKEAGYEKALNPPPPPEEEEEKKEDEESEDEEADEESEDKEADENNPSDEKQPFEDINPNEKPEPKPKDKEADEKNPSDKNNPPDDKPTEDKDNKEKKLEDTKPLPVGAAPAEAEEVDEFEKPGKTKEELVKEKEAEDFEWSKEFSPAAVTEVDTGKVSAPTIPAVAPPAGPEKPPLVANVAALSGNDGGSVRV